MKILHFADAHIDISSQNKRDPESGLPVRVMDFLKALDTIVDTAISRNVEMVLFAGDAYKDRNPAPIYQREWGRRIMRLSQAGIPTILLIGNHDISQSTGAASALHDFETLMVPNVHVISRPCFLKPKDIGLPVQILALPWISKSGMMAVLAKSGLETDVYEEIELRIVSMADQWLDTADKDIPVIFAAHGSVCGAVYGSERSVSFGSGVTIPSLLAKDPRIAYTALGHIHKYQDLNEGKQPPAIYPGSIERVDFGEVKEDKSFVIADVNPGNTKIERIILDGRKFIDIAVELSEVENIDEKIRSAIPEKLEIAGSMFRLTLQYPRSIEPMIDEKAIRKSAESAMEFHLSKKPIAEKRLRIEGDLKLQELIPQDQLAKYFDSIGVSGNEREELDKLFKDISETVNKEKE